MALIYPLSEAQFMGALRIEEATFRLSHPQEQSRLADGSIITASLGAALWTGTIRLAPAPHAEHAKMEALLALIDQPGASFLCYDPRQTGPRVDPDGAILGASMPVFHSIAANMRELRIAGLPAGYVLSTGDMLGFQYGTGPLRYALHRLVIGGVASGTGLSPWLEVIPALRTGAQVNTAVALKRPVCKARILPDPEFGAGRVALSRGASFGFVQTLR